jgi:hypothetical protein
MDFLSWLQDLGRDANPAVKGFQARGMYVLMCVFLPVVVGLFVGFGLRFIEQVLGVELGRGGRR